MGEEIRHHSTRVRRRRRHKSSVTNINIFAMTSSPEVVAQPALPVPAAAPAPAPSVEHPAVPPGNDPVNRLMTTSRRRSTPDATIAAVKSKG